MRRRAFLRLALLALLAPSAARAGPQGSPPPDRTGRPDRAPDHTTGQARLEFQLTLIESRLKLSPFQKYELRRIVAWEVDTELLEQGIQKKLSARALNQVLGLLRPEQKKPFIELLGPRVSELLDQARRRRQAKSLAGGQMALPLPDSSPLGGAVPYSRPEAGDRRGRRR